MSSWKFFIVLTITLVVGSLIKCVSPVSAGNNSIMAKFRFLFNNEEIVKTFIVNLPSSEIVKSDILPDIKAKQDQRLQESLLIQKEQLQQIQDMNSRLVQRMGQIENSQNNITSIMDLRLEKQLDTLRKEMKRLFESQQCEKKKSCAEIFMCLGYDSNGIHQLYLSNSNLKPFDAYCLQDPDNGPAWTVIQRRQDNTTDFYRGWEEYKHGFGNLNSNFFIGLEKLHVMTQAQPHELWIQLEYLELGKRSGKYDLFAIGSESDKYILNTLGNFSGDASDELTIPHKGCNFSTKDNDNDRYVLNCAEHRNGAWWYSSCGFSNLNGVYPNGKKIPVGGFMQWKEWYYSPPTLKYAHMAIRPKKIISFIDLL